MLFCLITQKMGKEMSRCANMKKAYRFLYTPQES